MSFNQVAVVAIHSVKGRLENDKIYAEAHKLDYEVPFIKLTDRGSNIQDQGFYL